MGERRKIILGLTFAALVAGLVVFRWQGDEDEGGREDTASCRSDRANRQDDESEGVEVPSPGRDDADAVAGDEPDADEPEESDGDEPQTEEEKREAAEEKLVNDFDDLTDKWMEPSKTGVTMTDVDSFAKRFRQIPKDRQDECIHRALNLIPDENVMLLAGVLMDKAVDKEIVETVFNDILNRDEDVKTPILQQIFKDKSHPCWADTAWILDVTDDLPKKE